MLATLVLGPERIVLVVPITMSFVRECEACFYTSREQGITLAIVYADSSIH